MLARSHGRSSVGQAQSSRRSASPSRVRRLRLRRRQDRPVSVQQLHGPSVAVGSARQALGWRRDSSQPRGAAARGADGGAARRAAGAAAAVRPRQLRLVPGRSGAAQPGRRGGGAAGIRGRPSAGRPRRWGLGRAGAAAGPPPAGGARGLPGRRLRGGQDPPVGCAVARGTGTRRSGTFVEYTNLIGALGFNAAVAAFAAQRLVCIDEFELDDPGDTVLMSTFLGKLVDQGVRLAATSNTLPDRLGEGASPPRTSCARSKACRPISRCSGSKAGTTATAVTSRPPRVVRAGPDRPRRDHARRQPG